jgi:hypothetical protein
LNHKGHSLLGAWIIKDILYFEAWFINETLYLGLNEDRHSLLEDMEKVALRQRPGEFYDLLSHWISHEKRMENGKVGMFWESEKGRKGEREKGRKGEREKGRKGEREKGRKEEREKGRKGERE